MSTPTVVTVTVPLDLPLALVNQIDHECSRLNMSISEKLSRDLIDAYNQRNAAEMEAAAAANLHALGGVDLHTFDSSNPLPLNAPPPRPSVRSAAVGRSALPSPGATGLTAG